MRKLIENVIHTMGTLVQDKDFVPTLLSVLHYSLQMIALALVVDSFCDILERIATRLYLQ